MAAGCEGGCTVAALTPLQVASRCLRAQSQPTFVLQLDTVKGEEEKSTFVDVDYAGMENLVRELHTAFQEMNSNHSKRLQRAVR